MIRYTTGDIFESEAHALVNPVNCVGVMGAGLAKHFKAQFPDNFKAYLGICKGNMLLPGDVMTYDRYQHGILGDQVHRYIINAATKDHFENDSMILSVEQCLYNIRDVIVSRNIESVAIPALGCGLGGLKWDDVRPLFESALRNMRAAVLVFEPK